MDSTAKIQSCRFFGAFRLRVLVVNYNREAWENNLEETLRTCNYEATYCISCPKALDLLKEKKQEFDLVMYGLQMNHEVYDLFEFLQHVTNLPVFVITNDDYDERALMKCLDLGVMSYFSEPLTSKDLKGIRQQVYTTRPLETRTLRGTVKEIQLKSGEELSRHNADTVLSGAKRKDTEDRNTTTEVGDSSKKEKKMQKLIWTSELHGQFIEAVNKIGIHNATASKILKEMNVQGITRDHISSHLQRYKLSLKRKQEENESNQNGR